MKSYFRFVAIALILPAGAFGAELEIRSAFRVPAEGKSRRIDSLGALPDGGAVVTYRCPPKRSGESQPEKRKADGMLCIARYSATGDVLWEKSFHTYARIKEIIDIDTRHDGSFCMVGTYAARKWGRLVLGGCDGPVKLPASENSYGLLACFSPEGQPLWAAGLISPGRNAWLGMDIFSDGSVVAAGVCEGQCTVQSTSGRTENVQGSDGTAIVARFAPSGAIDWVRSLEARGRSIAGGVAEGPKRGFFLTGLFSGDLVLGQKAVKSRGGSDGFLARFDELGNALWVRSLGGSAQGEETDAVFFPSVTENDDVVVSGVAAGRAYIEGGKSKPALLVASEKGSAFLAAYDSYGNLRWAKLLADGVHSRPFGQAVCTGGSVAVALRNWIAPYEYDPDYQVAEYLLAVYGPEGKRLVAYSIDGKLYDSPRLLRAKPSGRLLIPVRTCGRPSVGTFRPLSTSRPRRDESCRHYKDTFLIDLQVVP